MERSTRRVEGLTTENAAAKGQGSSTAPSSRLATRRRFLARAGAAAAAGMALPAFLPNAVSASPSETIRTGHIGIGGRGSGILGSFQGHKSVQVAALCEVDARRLAAARERAGKDIFATSDYRKVIERSDVDAVVIGTPDHWHAPITIVACEAGKDVYVEKPPSQNIAEGRRAVDAARKHKRVVQVGIQHRSADYNREIARIIRGGRIGRVHEVRCYMWENPRKPRTGPTAPPPELDWDFWLGPAPEVAYHPDRVHFNFRWCRDYAGGYMTDWGVHMMNVVTCAMDVDHKGPDSIEARGEFAPDNLYDFPMRMEATWQFSDPDFKLVWIQPSEGGDLLPDQRYSMTFYGEEGELRTGFGSGMHRFYRDGKESPLPREGREVDVPESPGHIENFIDCMRTRAQPIADIEIGHRTNVICLLANIALFSGKQSLKWDWQTERFSDAEANEWLGREARAKYAV